MQLVFFPASAAKIIFGAWRQHFLVVGWIGVREKRQGFAGIDRVLRMICHRSTLSQDKLCLRGCQPEVREGERNLQDQIRLGELPIESEEPFCGCISRKQYHDKKYLQAFHAGFDGGDI